MPIRKANWQGQQLIDPNVAMTAGQQPQADGVNAASSVLLNLLTFLNTDSMQWRVQSEYNNLGVDGLISSWADSNPTGKCYDPNDVGALIHLITYTEDGPLGQSPVQGFVALFVGDYGFDFQQVLNNYLTPNLRGGTPPAPPDTQEDWSFFWYTPS